MKNILFAILLFSTNCFSQSDRILTDWEFVNTATYADNIGKFTFTLASDLTTSAGVFKNDSILVRTLWSTERLNAGTYTRYWDGKDDNGNTIASPSAFYKIKILTNNVQYVWQGTIGNTSDSVTGITRHHGYYHAMRGLAFTSTHGYFVTGYSEGTPSIGKFNINTPHQRIEVASAGNADENYISTDGTNIYFASFDANSFENSFVHGIVAATDTDINFTNGFSFAPMFSNKTYRTIGYSNAAGSTITGLAVQKTGTNLFISRKGLNQINIVNKNTGSVVGNFSITSPGNLCIDGSDNLWVCEGTLVKKYNGTTGALMTTITGLVDAKAIQVSTDGSTITVADGGSSQQLKFYNNTTGAIIKTIGVANGYMGDANVSNSKFYFSDVNNTTVGAAGKLPFITYQSDGSYWVNDPGNMRVQHYNSSDSYINNIMCIGANYSVYVDKNDITKVLSGPLEFNIDYATQNITGFAGWNLVRNYGATVSSSTYDLFQFSKHFTTLSNGKRYGFIRKGNNYEVVEFQTTGTIRFTGILLNNLSSVLCSDGSYQTHTEASGISTIKRYPLTGFDGSSNPIWSATAETLISIVQDKLVGNPAYPPTNQIFTASNGKVILFNTGIEADAGIYHTGYHLGIYTRGANNIFLAQTEKSTHRKYSGEYPSAGWFDNGNMVNGYAGGQANILDRNVITSYHGEFWKNSQTNMYNHYYDNGLALGQFGQTGDKISGRSFSKMAGNAITPILVKDSNGDFYLYHGDESHFSAFHRWKITGLNTVGEIVIDISNPTNYLRPLVNYVDLMQGLPFNSTLTSGTIGWTRNPTANITADPYSNYWLVETSRQSYDYKKSNDITVSAVIPTVGTYKVERDLGTNNVTSSWELSGNLSYPKTAVNYNHGSDKQFLEVLDINGKTLTTFYLTGGYLANTNVYANTVMMATGNASVIESYLNSLLPYKILATSSGVTFSYGNFTPVTTTISDPSADWTKPKTLLLRFENAGGSFYGKDITIQDFKFYKNHL